MADLRKFLDEQGLSNLWAKINAGFIDTESLSLIVTAIDEAIKDLEDRADLLEQIPIYSGTGTKTLKGNTTSNTSSGSHSSAFGYSTKASGSYAFAEGYSTQALASGAHSEGYKTTANNTYSHAEGYYTIASASYQHVQGKYNESNATLAHIVGNGTGTNARSNAHTLDWSGNAEYAGDVVANGCGGNDPISLVETGNNLSQVLWRGVLLTGSITFNVAEKYLHDDVLTLLFETSKYKAVDIDDDSSPNTTDNSALISIACSNTTIGNSYYTPHYDINGDFVIYHPWFGEDVSGIVGVGHIGLTVQLRRVPTSQNIICTVTINGGDSLGLKDVQQFLHTISAINIKGAE